MKTKSLALPAVFLAILSCETHDPSALGELQRDLAEAVAKNTRLEEEISSLTDQLEEAKRQPVAEPEKVELPSRQEIEQSLAIEGTKLQQAARDLHPSAQVEGFSTFDLNIPSFETPFSCKAKVVLREPSGVAKTLYWVGKANMKGEWTFEKAENLEPDPVVSNQGTRQPNNDTKVDIPLTAPLDIPNNTPAPPAPPAPPKKPEPKYDIPLDNPVMKPRGR